MRTAKSLHKKYLQTTPTFFQKKKNISDKEGLFPLELAALHGLLDIVEILLKSGADIAHTSHNGYTPLHWASHGGFPDVITLLVKNGADINGAFSKLTFLAVSRFSFFLFLKKPFCRSSEVAREIFVK